MAVKGLSKAGAETIIAEREQRGDYKSLEDFSRRVRLGWDDITALCPAGVFDSISGGLARTMRARELLKSNTGARAKGQDELFAVEGHHRSIATGVLTGTRKKTNPDELWGEIAALEGKAASPSLARY
jgi:DNA polymerase III alpha subunit